MRDTNMGWKEPSKVQVSFQICPSSYREAQKRATNSSFTKIKYSVTLLLGFGHWNTLQNKAHNSQKAQIYIKS